MVPESQIRVRGNIQERRNFVIRVALFDGCRVEIRLASVAVDIKMIEN